MSVDYTKGTFLLMPRRKKWIPLYTVLAFGIVGTIGASGALLSIPKEDRDGSGIRAPVDENDLRNDPRVRAFVQAYGPLIDSVTYGEEDVVFRPW